MSVAASVLTSAGQDPVLPPWTYPDVLQGSGTLGHVKYGIELIFVREDTRKHVHGCIKQSKAGSVSAAVLQAITSPKFHSKFGNGDCSRNPNEQMFSALSIRLKNKNSMANFFFFSMLTIISFHLPPGFRTLGFQFYGISSEIYFMSSRTADFVIFISVQEFHPEEKYQIH